MSSRQEERIVDTCFEEGQFQSAISVLNLLRSSSRPPSLSHIRQLIYIALHPLSTPKTDKAQNKSIYDTPTKQPAHHVIPSHLSPSAVMAAQQLLMSFAVTHPPSYLAPALPSYCSIDRVGRKLIDDPGDSDISKESVCINEAKDCWALLIEGFLSRGKALFSTPRNKGRRRRGSTEDDVFLVPAHQSVEHAIIGDASWPVLDWILTLFERDEQFVHADGQPRYSQLLLDQIPPSRNGTSGRLDIETPLAVLMYCLQQSCSRRQRMGYRLMTLLINLATTSHLDFPMFVAAIFSHLSTVVPEIFRLLLSSLPPSSAVQQFKVALCYKFICEVDSGQQKPTQNSRLKPQARARVPRATRTTPASSLSLSFIPPAKIIKCLPSCQAILTALETQPKRSLSETDAKSLVQVKFELLTSYGIVQKEACDDDKDLEWTKVLEQSRLNGILDATFNHGNKDVSTKYRTLAQAVVSMWT
ncbi:hypothetical protein AMATHDRAFT_38604 [Amanita thiersii Skay4041]|uniref:Uncharacterized protein n=1 Tax=Amanita thiersii Skay4041 TaxID=703135 RepID=A0A2A9P022_9AGAR|nr:hypothetical protein AMATHDRAFT_38604 [Amanita thiersii Skay4041]